MEPRISIITLGVQNLSKSTKFYEQGLGFTKSSSSNEGITFFRTQGCVLALYPLAKLAEDVSPDFEGKPPKFSGVTLAHNVQDKAQVDVILELAKDHGARIEKPGQDTFWGGYSGYFSDLDGHLWEIAWGAFDFNDDGSLKLD